MSTYSEYLQKRHPLSFWYRKYLLYPRYRAWLPGRGLEIGCGLGEFLSTCNRFEGVDIDEDLLDICREKGLPVKQGSASESNGESQSYDAVLLDNVFEHVEDPDQCLEEIKRVLRAGGRALIVVPNRLGYQRDQTHVKYWDETNLPGIVEAHELVVVRGRHFPIPWKKPGNLLWPYNTYALLLRKP